MVVILFQSQCVNKDLIKIIASYWTGKWLRVLVWFCNATDKIEMVLFISVTVNSLRPSVICMLHKNFAIKGSENGLGAVWHQAITNNNADLLLIEPLAWFPQVLMNQN